MNKVDWSYLKYPKHSYGRVIGRRKEAWKLASRIYDFSLDSADSPLKSFMYGNAYLDLAMAEADRVTHNNWLKMHGMVMHRRKHGKGKT